MSVMEISEILRCIPHRYPFLLIDRVLKIDPGKSLVAIKNVSVNEPFFQGHFPGHPIMPGVLILEALAQACCVLADKSRPDAEKASPKDGADKEANLHLFAGIDNARFKKMVVPGDQLRLQVEVLRKKQGIFKFGAEATVGNQLACSADLICAFGVKVS